MKKQITLPLPILRLSQSYGILSDDQSFSRSLPIEAKAYYLERLAAALNRGRRSDPVESRDLAGLFGEDDQTLSDGSSSLSTGVQMQIDAVFLEIRAVSHEAKRNV